MCITFNWNVLCRWTVILVLSIVRKALCVSYELVR